MPCRPPPININGLALFSFMNRANAAGGDLDIQCTSWYRSPIENMQAGGHPFSQHLVGWAVDVAGPDEQLFAKRARLAGLNAVTEGDHVHVQLLGPGILQFLLGQ